jgi:Golgi SNAP receptor complex protein 1
VGDGNGPIGTSDGGDGRSLLDHAEAGVSAPGNKRKDGMSSNISNKNVDEEEAMLSKDIHRTMTTMTELITTRMAPAAERTGRPQHSLLVKRYREILFDCGADYSKTSAAVARKREARELFRGATSSGGAGGGDASTEQLLRERNAIDNSMKSANSVLGQAANVRSELRAQGASLRGVTGTMAQIAGNVPGLNGLMDMIRKKRQQDDRVVGGVVAACILFTLWYLFG